MKVVLDTNIIFADYFLNGAKIRNLCESVKTTGDIIYIPEVVSDEAINQYKENLQKCKLKIDSAVSDYERLTNKEFEKMPISDEVLIDEFENYIKVYNEQIKKLGINIIPYPSVLHKDIVKRDLARKKPFTVEGKGYRDALIWESIKSLCEEPFDTLAVPEIIFICKNPKDFCEKDYSLHHDLKEDLEDNHINDSAIKVMESVDKFINEYIKLKQKILKNILGKLDKDKQYKEIDLAIEIETRISKFLLYRDFGFEDSPFRQEFENPSIVSIDTPIITVRDVRQISEEEIFIDVNVEVDCEFDFYIYKGDLAAIDDEDIPYIWNRDWNKHYVAASKSATVTLRISFIVDKSFKNILSDDIEIILND